MINYKYVYNIYINYNSFLTVLIHASHKKNNYPTTSIRDK